METPTSECKQCHKLRYVGFRGLCKLCQLRCSAVISVDPMLNLIIFAYYSINDDEIIYKKHLPHKPDRGYYGIISLPGIGNNRIAIYTDDINDDGSINQVIHTDHFF
jgi:hypothetical protein